jgi:hypothetical protein
LIVCSIFVALLGAAAQQQQQQLLLAIYLFLKRMLLLLLLLNRRAAPSPGLSSVLVAPLGAAAATYNAAMAPGGAALMKMKETK